MIERPQPNELGETEAALLSGINELGRATIQEVKKLAGVAWEGGEKMRLGVSVSGQPDGDSEFWFGYGVDIDVPECAYGRVIYDADHSVLLESRPYSINDGDEDARKAAEEIASKLNELIVRALINLGFKDKRVAFKKAKQIEMSQLSDNASEEDFNKAEERARKKILKSSAN